MSEDRDRLRIASPGYEICEFPPDFEHVAFKALQAENFQFAVYHLPMFVNFVKEYEPHLRRCGGAESARSDYGDSRGVAFAIGIDQTKKMIFCCLPKSSMSMTEHAMLAAHKGVTPLGGGFLPRSISRSERKVVVTADGSKIMNVGSVPESITTIFSAALQLRLVREGVTFVKFKHYSCYPNEGKLSSLAITSRFLTLSSGEKLTSLDSGTEIVKGKVDEARNLVFPANPAQVEGGGGHLSALFKTEAWRQRRRDIGGE
jgi:hypothetical protein